MPNFETEFTTDSDMSMNADSNTTTASYFPPSTLEVGREVSGKDQWWWTFLSQIRNFNLPKKSRINWARIAVEAAANHSSALSLKFGVIARTGIVENFPGGIVDNPSCSLSAQAASGTGVLRTTGPIPFPHAGASFGFRWSAESQIDDPVTTPYMILDATTGGDMPTTDIALNRVGTAMSTVSFVAKLYNVTSGDPDVTMPPTLELITASNEVVHQDLGTSSSIETFTWDTTPTLVFGQWYAVGVEIASGTLTGDSLSHWSGGSLSRDLVLHGSCRRFLSKTYIDSNIPGVFNRWNFPYAGTLPMPNAGVNFSLISGSIFAESDTVAIPSSPGLTSGNEYVFGDGGLPAPDFDMNLTTMLQAWVDDPNYPFDRSLTLFSRSTIQSQLSANFKSLAAGTDKALRLTVNYDAPGKVMRYGF